MDYQYFPPQHIIDLEKQFSKKKIALQKLKRMGLDCSYISDRKSYEQLYLDEVQKDFNCNETEYLKNGVIQIYYICKKCESIDSNERRKKTDKINELTHKQKYHLKKKANDPEYLKKKVKEMQDYRKRKALEKQST